MKKNWTKSANNFSLQEISSHQEKLDVGIYKLNTDPFGNFFLSQIGEKFVFDYKIYNSEKKFVERVVKTYNNTTDNLGVLLNGKKGTGKSVTAKQLCNALNLPVIIIHHRFEGMPNFINEIQQDVVLFVDEYEKVYPNYDSNILTLMDGVLTNEYRKTFILTTNEMYVNQNMLQRPGRIRYYKTFSDLSLETINEIVDDMLKYPEFRQSIMDFLSIQELITIDIVITTVEEVNIHQEPPADFRSFFNARQTDISFNVYRLEEIEDEQSKTTKEHKYLQKRNATVNIRKFKPELVGQPFRIDDVFEGYVHKVIDEQTAIIKDEDNDLLKYFIEDCNYVHSSFHPSFVF